MERVTVLALDEAVRLDQARLSDLYVELGEREAEDLLCRAMEDLSVRLGRCERAYYAENGSAVIEAAAAISQIASELGMTALARVARDVDSSARVADPVALAATLARLVRIGDSSLSAIWDPHHVSV